MPPYVTPNLGDAPKEMQSEADRVYKGLRESKFHKETPADRESASRVMWSVLKKTWTKDPKTGKWTKKQKNMDYNDGPSTTAMDYAGAMELIAVGTDDRPDSDYDSDELKMGIETEMEHTSDASIASKIAKDQLDEDPRFYSKNKEYETSLRNMALESIYEMDRTRESLVAMKGTGDPSIDYDIQKSIDGLDKAKEIATSLVNGGPGSGNFGHAGRPGEVGGSGDGQGGQSKGKAYTRYGVSFVGQGDKSQELLFDTNEDRERWIKERSPGKDQKYVEHKILKTFEKENPDIGTLKP